MAVSKKLGIMLAICTVLVLGLVLSTTVSADTYEDTDLSATLTVNTYVDTSLDSAALTFGSLNPGTTDNAASENAVTLTNTANSNTAVDVYLNNTQMTSGGNTMPCSALSVDTDSNPTGATDFDCTNYLNGNTADNGYVEGVAVSGTQELYFWHDVPTGQAAGAYTATVTVHSVGDGLAP